MKGIRRLLLPLFLCAGLPAAQGQDAPPAAVPAPDVRPEPERRPAWRDMSDAERMRWREQRRDAWRRMSPEERHQLRRDIRDAGAEIYLRRHGRRDPRDER
jgi:hypothetical protein